MAQNVRYLGRRGGLEQPAWKTENRVEVDPYLLKLYQKVANYIDGKDAGDDREYPARDNGGFLNSGIAHSVWIGAGREMDRNCQHSRR
jgi:hypothetical protein